MASSTRFHKDAHAITIHPGESVMTGFPLQAQSSLLDYLNGEPQVLGTTQILLGLIMASLGIIFAFNLLTFLQSSPFVFTTGFPFWGALIFVVTGYFTSTKKSQNYQYTHARMINGFCSLIALIGIILTIMSFRDQHLFCQKPSIEGICILGRVFLTGILSVILIICIVEFSISLTVVTLRNQSWTRANEIMFLLPSDITEKSERPSPAGKTHLQDEPPTESAHKTANANAFSQFKLPKIEGPLIPTTHALFFQDPLPQIMPVPSQQYEGRTLAYQDMPTQGSSERALTALEGESSNEQVKDVKYQDIRSEVILLTQEWNTEGKSYDKSSKRHSLDLQSQSKGLQFPKRRSLDLQGQKAPRRKSIDERIKSWFSPMRKSVDQQRKLSKSSRKKSLALQTTEKERTTEDQQVQDGKFPNRQDDGHQFPAEQDTRQQADEEKSPKGKYKDRPLKGRKAQEKSVPKAQYKQAQESQLWQPPRMQFAVQETQGWRFTYQQGYDWVTQGWRNKDWKAQEWQFETQNSRNWQSQDLLEREALKQRALYQDTQTQHFQRNLDHQLPEGVIEDIQDQVQAQEDLPAEVTPKEDTQGDSMQTEDIKSGYVESRGQNSEDLKSENMGSNAPSSSSVSDLNSEQDVQVNTSISSTSCKEDTTSGSSLCYLKQSEDSD
ncbi:PREDICTED: membrane-spanning 4-domains subfamily A member 14 [Elephantulus edwardii]|uniref:membrane-spanning 4-domains subfamily A member 14 n=1 Tax=Elephantulus edwardii TaxID=28737 RepID=UPI0003F0DE45|nr:PREDICTED: membrane-spanning 4-domains subfamily A member 14 [Elephantulus edwardii]